MAADFAATRSDADDHGDDGEADGCLCGSGIAAADATSDDQLPAASGGVEAAPPSAANEDHIDGHAVLAGVADVATDKELPAAAGGVL